MNDIFPAIERRFNADADCVTRCRKLYPVGDDVRGPKAYARWTESPGDNLDAFGTDITEHSGEFVLYSSSTTPDKARLMADAITRAFDDAVISQGGFARIDMHRTSQPVPEYVDGVYEVTIPYTVYAVLDAKTPVNVG